jgi:hypothetical protein
VEEDYTVIHRLAFHPPGGAPPADASALVEHVRIDNGLAEPLSTRKPRDAGPTTMTSEFKTTPALRNADVAYPVSGDG